MRTAAQRLGASEQIHQRRVLSRTGLHRTPGEIVKRLVVTALRGGERLLAAVARVGACRASRGLHSRQPIDRAPTQGGEQRQRPNDHASDSFPCAAAERFTPGAVSRRTFLSTAGATTAAALMPRFSFAAAEQTTAIVGAGIAGLNCALALADAGIRSTVYEASGHLGGRMFSNTNYFNANQVTEWGGELIDTFGGYERVRQGGVLFCGEHTSVDFQGFMEGAASEGERAAREWGRLIVRD